MPSGRPLWECYPGNALPRLRRKKALLIQRSADERLLASITWIPLPAISGGIAGS